VVFMYQAGRFNPEKEQKLKRVNRAKAGRKRKKLKVYYMFMQVFKYVWIIMFSCS